MNKNIMEYGNITRHRCATKTMFVTSLVGEVSGLLVEGMAAKHSSYLKWRGSRMGLRLESCQPEKWLSEPYK